MSLIDYYAYTALLRTKDRRIAALEAELAQAKEDLDDADEEAEEYCYQMKLAMHANYRKRKHLKKLQAPRRTWVERLFRLFGNPHA